VNLLQHIAQSRSLLRKSELKVADHVLLDPASVMHSSMADLAHTVGVSEPTIVRFCRAIGCLGFQDLKLKLAQSLAAGASFGQFAISENDSVADFALKIFDTTLHTLMEVRERLDPDALQRAITAMAKAERVEFYGFGASGAVATDAQHKFFRFNLAVTAHSDVLMQRMLASVAHTGELFVIISYTGRTRELVEVARIARQNGASVLGLTAAGSPLAQASTLSLNIPLPEDTDIYMPMTSRIIQLTVLDVLATGMTLRRGVDFQPHLRKVKESLNASRYPADEEPS